LVLALVLALAIPLPTAHYHSHRHQRRNFSFDLREYRVSIGKKACLSISFSFEPGGGGEGKRISRNSIRNIKRKTQKNTIIHQCKNKQTTVSTSARKTNYIPGQKKLAIQQCKKLIILYKKHFKAVNHCKTEGINVNN
jgi:hypothetical protein